MNDDEMKNLELVEALMNRASGNATKEESEKLDGLILSGEISAEDMEKANSEVESIRALLPLIDEDKEAEFPEYAMERLRTKTKEVFPDSTNVKKEGSSLSGLFGFLKPVLTFSIVVSSFVALTLSPMLGSKFLNKNTKKSKIVLKFEKYYKSFLEFYSETLNYWINKQKLIIGFMFFVVMASVLLKTLGVPTVVARAKDTLHANTLRRIGVDRVIQPEEEMGTRLAHSLFNASVEEYLEITNNYGVSRFRVPEKFAGTTLEQLGFTTNRDSYGLTPLAMCRGRKVTLNPALTTNVKPNDFVIVAARDSDLESLDNAALVIES